MKKVLSLVLVLVAMAALMTVSVFAELPTFAPATDGTYSVPYTEGTSGGYYALLVVQGVYAENETPVISEDTVLYIDQATANSNGDVSFDGWIPKNEEPATVYLGGGTNGPVLLGYLGSNTFVVSGTVSTDSGTSYEAIVTLTDAEGNAFSGTSVSGAYAVEVPEGNYTFVVNVKNHLSYTDADFAVTGDVSGKDVAVKGGDLDADDEVGFSDLSEVLNNYRTTNGELDIEGDSAVDFSDLSIILNNYRDVSVSE